MAFCFKRKERVAKAVRRLGRRQSEAALECLRECEEGKGVHGARKNIKKARAILRMVQPQSSKKIHRRQSRLLREAAAQLSSMRDAYVAAQALKDLRRHFNGRIASGALRRLDNSLQKALQFQTRQFQRDHTARKVERLLRQTARRWDDFRFDARGWKAIGAGIETAYKRGRKAYFRAQKDQTAENFHEWRKRAKDLSCELRLLRPIWPGQIDAMANELETLADCLGDDHDLVLLEQAAEQNDGEKNSGEMEMLHGLAQQRHTELRGSALALGARFYEAKPRLFCNRLAAYWRMWHRKKENKTALETARDEQA